MELNEALKSYAVEHLDVATDASDDDFRAAIAKALQDGKLTGAKYAELVTAKDSQPESVVDKLADAFAKRMETVLASQKQPEPKAEKKPEPKAETEDDKVQAIFEKVMAQLPKNVGTDLESLKKANLSEDEILKDAALVEKDETGRVVANPLKRYSEKAYQAKRKSGILRGEPIKHNGRYLDEPSERDLAMIGSWFKYTVCPEYLSDHEKEIVAHILENERFVGTDATRTEKRKLRDDEISRIKGFYGRKAPLIDDSTSGGQEAVPEWYDTHVIVLPVLGGEVAPFVTMVDVPRGSEAETFTISNPTFASNATEGSAVSLFDATSMMADYSPAIFRAHGGIELGRNFLQDAAVDIARVIIDRYGAKAAEWVDEQICNGDGTTEPQGLKNASGTVDITAGTPTTGPLTVSDCLNLLFGVTKAYRDNYPKRNMAFIMTDETYKDLRSIATGVTGDTRLIFGGETGDNGGVFSYSLFGVPVAIEENGMTNNDVIFAQLGGYRLYRRQGLRFVRENRGQELVTSNSELIYADMRYGGQIERGAYAAVMDSAPS